MLAQTSQHQPSVQDEASVRVSSDWLLRIPITGMVRRRVEVSVIRVSSCFFGTLFINSMLLGVGDAGMVFVVWSLYI